MLVMDDEFEQMFRRVERESEMRAAWDRNMRRAASKNARDEEIIKHRRRSSVPNTPALDEQEEDDMLPRRSPRPTSMFPAEYQPRNRSPSVDSFESYGDNSAKRVKALDTLKPSAKEKKLSRRTSTLGRTVGNLIPRMGRPRSTSAADVLSNPPPVNPQKMVIGVSVEKATAKESQTLPPTTVYATVRPKKSNETLFDKVAKGINRKRKSVLPVFNKSEPVYDKAQEKQ